MGGSRIMMMMMMIYGADSIVDAAVMMRRLEVVRK